MLASLVSNLINVEYWFSNPWLPLVSLFSLWMLIDAIRRREWVWAFFIFVGFGFSAVLYYFAVYRAAPSATRGFEVAGSWDRRHNKGPQAQIYQPDTANHHS